jgi:hypothetical protein
VLPDSFKERWPSGLRYTLGKRAYGFNRTAGSNPALSAVNMKYDFDNKWIYVFIYYLALPLLLPCFLTNEKLEE